MPPKTAWALVAIVALLAMHHLCVAEEAKQTPQATSPDVTVSPDGYEYRGMHDSHRKGDYYEPHHEENVPRDYYPQHIKGPVGPTGPAGPMGPAGRDGRDCGCFEESKRFTINFNDVRGLVNGTGPVPSGYKGFEWQGAATVINPFDAFDPNDECFTNGYTNMALFTSVPFGNTEYSQVLYSNSFFYMLAPPGKVFTVHTLKVASAWTLSPFTDGVVFYGFDETQTPVDRVFTGATLTLDTPTTFDISSMKDLASLGFGIVVDGTVDHPRCGRNRARMVIDDIVVSTKASTSCIQRVTGYDAQEMLAIVSKLRKADNNSTLP